MRAGGGGFFCYRMQSNHDIDNHMCRPNKIVDQSCAKQNGVIIVQITLGSSDQIVFGSQPNTQASTKRMAAEVWLDYRDVVVLV